MDRAAIVAEARTWLGTPFHEQASVKGVGCDCLGLIMGVAAALGLAAVHGELKAAAISYNPTRIDPALLKIGLGRHMDRIGAIEPGAVLLWKVGRPLKAQHLAIAIDDVRMIHTWGKGKRTQKVIDAPIGSGRMELLDSIWRFRGLTDG